MLESRSERRVAIVGGGPAGLVAARWLKQYGYEPVIFEQSDNIGGQWHVKSPYSAVWPSMRTNSSWVMTSFSDLELRVPTTYMSNEQMLEYLLAYAEKFHLWRNIRLNTQVQMIDRLSDGAYRLRTKASDGSVSIETFPKVIIASGQHNIPKLPKIQGLEQFSGAAGAIHSAAYNEVKPYNGKRVLVAGCSISALEIASDLAMYGAGRVVSTARRQRYVFQKLVAGLPLAHILFTRYMALAREILPREEIGDALRGLVVNKCGSPEQYGARKPAEDFFKAGTTMSQYFLPFVAEGRITTRPWIKKVTDDLVTFDDGTEERFDGIIFGTGYEMNLSFLSESIRRTLNFDGHGIDLHKFTFHPDLPGLAFLGILPQFGSYFPLVELQSRWVTYLWEGLSSSPSKEEFQRGLEFARAIRGQYLPSETLIVMFARLISAEPDLAKHPDIARALLFGPLSAASFRIDGRDSLLDAKQRFVAHARAFGAVTSEEFTNQEMADLEKLLPGELGEVVNDLLKHKRRRPVEAMVG